MNIFQGYWLFSLMLEGVYLPYRRFLILCPYKTRPDKFGCIFIYSHKY